MKVQHSSSLSNKQSTLNKYLWNELNVGEKWSMSCSRLEHACMPSHVRLFATPWTVTCQAPFPWDFPGKDIGNLTSDSSALSKSSLNIWKFTAHIPLKPGLKNFEHYFASVCDECNCTVPFFGIGMKTDLCQSCVHCWVFQIGWHIEWSIFTASSFRILK